MSRERDKYGATATIINLDTGEWGAVVRTGTNTIEALRAIVERIDVLGPAWRIACISTPVTILRDLQGSRVRIDGSLKPSLPPHRPEWALLGRIGRLDLLAPRGTAVAHYDGPGSVTLRRRT